MCGYRLDGTAFPFGAVSLTVIHVARFNVRVSHRCPEKEHYSRKPGFTETRLRPFARRRESTLAPLFVFMRVRKPCFFERLRRLG